MPSISLYVYSLVQNVQPFSKVQYAIRGDSSACAIAEPAKIARERMSDFIFFDRGEPSLCLDLACLQDAGVIRLFLTHASCKFCEARALY